MATLLITGGAGFIGSAVIRFLMANTDWRIINVDKLTYAANLSALQDAEQSARYQLAQVDIGDTKRKHFRFHHVSTDEVYGDLATPAAPAFNEALAA